MTLREKILTEFASWDTVKQQSEFNAYKQLDSYSPLNNTDYKLMEQVMNNSSTQINCENGNCSISTQQTKTLNESDDIDSSTTDTLAPVETTETIPTEEITEPTLETEEELMAQISTLITKIVELRVKQ